MTGFGLTKKIAELPEPKPQAYLFKQNKFNFGIKSSQYSL